VSVYGPKTGTFIGRRWFVAEAARKRCGRMDSDSKVTVAATNIPSGAESHTWDDASYMRALAHRCSRAARDCPHRPTSLELEAIGVELMEKAAEIDELNQMCGGDDSPARPASNPRKPKT
jgi:hypothetical protein